MSVNLTAPQHQRDYYVDLARLQAQAAAEAPVFSNGDDSNVKDKTSLRYFSNINDEGYADHGLDGDDDVNLRFGGTRYSFGSDNAELRSMFMRPLRALSVLVRAIPVPFCVITILFRAVGVGVVATAICVISQQIQQPQPKAQQRPSLSQPPRMQ